MRDEEQSVHWSQQREAARSYLPLKITLCIFRVFPLVLIRLVAFAVGACYYLFSPRIRRESSGYLREARLAFAARNQRFRGSPLLHIISFALALTEKIESWGGKTPFKRINFQNDDIEELIARLDSGEGAMLLSSHLGNMEFIRALAGFNKTGVSREIPVTAIVDITVSAHFNRALRELNPQSMTRLMSVADVGPDTIPILQERLASGELAAIAGDRTSSNVRGKYFTLPFLGRDAAFAYGPYLLAALADAPIYAIFALRSRDISLSSRYDIHIIRCPVSFDCPRREREARIEALARWFVSLLERYCLEHPYQWYNFYDFWAPVKREDGGAQ